MDERERRRAYRHNAVLIDSDRVLTPQFDDAVVYLTGAQLELLRNVSQYLNRRETYRAEKHPGYYLMPDDSDYDDILAIVADMEESLMGNPNTIWGYKEQWFQQVVIVRTGDGDAECITTPVPAGYVYVLENVYSYHNGGTTRSAELFIDEGTATMTLYMVPALPSNDLVIMPVSVTMKEGDTVNWLIDDLADTKHALLRVMGHKMVVPE